jgi:hypothetical protein
MDQTKIRNNMEELIPIVAIISTFGGGILFTKVLTDYFLKRKVIDKGVSGEEADQILHASGSNKYSGLKWGLITLAAGIGLIIINYVPYDGDTPFPYGVLAICISLGFLTYYFMVKDK